VTSTATVTAVACSNFALCKYWGKSDLERNVPVVPSLSMTVGALTTRTTVEPLGAGETTDRVILAGRLADPTAFARVVAQLDRLRARRIEVPEGGGAGGPWFAVTSENSFPTGAGLASSASAFAALTAAAARALGLVLTLEELSDLARRASASAARSLHGGFVELPAGAPGTEWLPAHPVEVAQSLDLRLLVAVTSESAKAVGSRDGMNRTMRTSPYYAAWAQQAPEELATARAALAAGELGVLGEVMERSAMRMHASAMAAAPPILYWTSGTVEVLGAVRRLRERGVEAYFTIDAGPNVKVLCRAADAARARTALSSVRGVLSVIESGVGGPVQVNPGAA
jgi:diphosphomevalonate decarboxylase